MGVYQKEHPQKYLFFKPPTPCLHVANLPSPCVRPQLALHTALWSDSAIAEALKIGCSLISSSSSSNAAQSKDKINRKVIFKDDMLPQCLPYIAAVYCGSCCSIGPSFYGVHIPSPSLCPHEPDPSLWTSTCGRHEIHIALLERLVQ